MKTMWRLLLPIVLCITAIAQNNSTSTADRPTYITQVVVIDTETGREAPDQTVIVSGEKIVDIRASGTTPAPMNARIVNGKGKYLIPGLWDMHVHTWDDPSTYPLYVANGVTGVRDMDGPPDINKFRAELAAKAVLAPHFYLAGPVIDGNPKGWPTSIAVTTAEEARRVVDEEKQNGADFIKVYDRLSRDAYLAIIDEGRKLNTSVVGHVPFAVSAWEAAAAKQKSFEHLNGIQVACSSREADLWPKAIAGKSIKERNPVLLHAYQSYSEDKCQRLFAEMKKNGVWADPTLTVARALAWVSDPQFRNDSRLRYFSGAYRDWLAGKPDTRRREFTAADYQIQRELFSERKKLTGAMFRSGVPLLAGTDTGNPYCFPGFSLHDELALLVESGLTPLAALQAATRNPAVFMNATDRYGSISKGRVADLVLLDADPLQDIHNTTKISEVFLDGREFDRASLDGILRTAETAANASDQLLNRMPVGVAPGIEMQQLSRLFAGRWSGTLTTAPGSRDAGTADEIWRLSPGGLTLVEENRLSTPKGSSFDYAAVWWNRKAQKYQGVWCADINDEGCSGFDAQAESDRMTMTGEWEQTGHRRAWREVFSRPDQNSSIQTLEVGEPGGELKRVSAITATKIAEGSTELSNVPAQAELRADMAERRRASIEGDVDTVANSMTDDYVQTDINGYRQDKTTWLNEYFKPLADLISAGKFRWDEYDQKNLQFRFYGDCAIVTGELQAKGTGAKFGPHHTWVADSNGFSGILHFTHVYIKQNGKWMLAALHNQIPLPTDKSAK